LVDEDGCREIAAGELESVLADWIAARSDALVLYYASRR
jgi:hypothetical protein